MPLSSFFLPMEVAGGCIASCALLPLWGMAGIVRSPALKRAWLSLTGIVGCCVILLFWSIASKFGRAARASDLSEAAIHFLGPSFVWGVAQLSRRTAKDVLRIDALEEAANVDDLTGLANRRRMRQRLDVEVQDARSRRRPLSVIAIDIDHFKGVNDAHGHEAGDHVLRHVAELLADSVRSTDMVCRVGGEEFVAVVPGLDSDHVAALAERLRSVVGQTSIPFSAVRHIEVTISLGIASLKADEEASQLLNRADAALYEARRSGRDRLRRAA